MGAKKVYLMTGGPGTDMNQLAADFRAALSECGKPSPSVAYVGTASGDDRRFFGWLKRPILRAGAGSVELVPIAGKKANADTAKRMLTEADAIFLTGGEVEDGMVWLEKRGLVGLLRELYSTGKPFFGISAGCIMMGRNWVHWDVEGDDSTARLFDCLGFVPYTFDAHGEKEDWAELKCALRLMGDGAVGHGLSNGGAYTADENGKFSSFRNAPALFCNIDGKIERQK
ncbi:MAG: Type 1 glutamine amidotransferase-like domain-containing protein [Oscillospiraceae bacterium]|nr:Type 1 glutamine amidotransferase-like domain-containing protein [Oscillospiraceae bacterium]